MFVRATECGVDNIADWMKLSIWLLRLALYNLSSMSCTAEYTQISQTFEAEILNLEASVLVDPQVSFFPPLERFRSSTNETIYRFSLRWRLFDTSMFFPPSSSGFVNLLLLSCA